MMMLRSLKSVRVLSLVVLVPLFSACSEPPPPPVENIRAIRSVMVSEPASGKMRRFSGVVEAADTSNISFEVSGNVRAVNVNVGERVSKGQALASLDDRTFRLNVEAAEAGVASAEVAVNDALQDLQRQQRIAAQDRGAITERSLELAQAGYASARQNLSYSTSRLNLAKRDLERTTLYAPFDGIIAERHIDPFEEINRGQKLFVLFVEGVMEAAISVPESEIDQVFIGLHSEVRFPAIAGQVNKGIVNEISTVAGTANAFPVRVAIEADADNVRIRPGITAEVVLMLGGDDGDMSYLIPVGALSPGGADGSNYVFVYDTESSTVRRTAIEDDGIRDSDVVVTSGLKAGDIIAVAGVSFLRDGQKVRLMEQ